MQLGDESSKHFSPRTSSGGMNVRSRLSLAVATLLGANTNAVGQETEVDSAVLVYSEPNRVAAVEGVVLLRHLFENEHSLSAKFVYDALTGASPNGATPARQAQTFTRPSGRGSYEVPSGETPLDDTFRDTRLAGTLGYQRAFRSSGGLSFGVNGSGEHDYVSLGGNLGLTWSWDRQNSTASLGFSGTRDEVSPEGGVPRPLAEMGTPGSQDRIGSSDTKSVFDVVLGWTQVLTRTSLARFNYSLSSSSGYLTDPYKLVTVVAEPGNTNAGDPLRYLYESRPSDRTKHSVYSQYRTRIARTTLDVSYRFLWDTWGVRSHTGDLTYRVPVSSHFAIAPHVRYYHQSEADFHHLFLANGEPLPTHVSADPRLGGMDAWTFGSRIDGFHVGPHQIAVTLEYYHQFLSADDESQAFGSLAGLDLTEDAGAFMFRISHSWDR